MWDGTAWPPWEKSSRRETCGFEEGESGFWTRSSLIQCSGVVLQEGKWRRPVFLLKVCWWAEWGSLIWVTIPVLSASRGFESGHRESMKNFGGQCVNGFLSSYSLGVCDVSVLQPFSANSDLRESLPHRHLAAMWRHLLASGIPSAIALWFARLKMMGGVRGWIAWSLFVLGRNWPAQKRLF